MTLSIETPPMPLPTSDRLPLLVSILWLSMLGALIGNIQPMFLGALSTSLGLNAQQLGLLGGIELGGACLASLSAFYWFPRANLQRVALFAIVVCIAGNVLTTWADDYASLLGLRFTTGLLGEGVLYAMSLGLVGQMRNPDRIIAIAIIVQVLSLAVGMAAIPVLLERWQLPGMTLAMALLYTTGLLALRQLPAHRIQAQSDVRVEVSGGAFGWLLPAALLLSLVVFSVGLGSIWAFLERIGASAGFGMADIGKALALAGFIGGLGALVAMLLGQRLGRLLPLSLGIAGQLGVCVMLGGVASWPVYIIAVALFNFFWNLVLPYLLGAIGSADASGRFMVLIPAAQTAGYAIGPVIAGLFIVGDGYATAASVSLVVFAVCLLMVVPLVSRLNQS